MKRERILLFENKAGHYSARQAHFPGWSGLCGVSAPLGPCCPFHRNKSLCCGRRHWTNGTALHQHNSEAIGAGFRPVMRVDTPVCMPSFLWQMDGTTGNRVLRRARLKSAGAGGSGQIRLQLAWVQEPMGACTGFPGLVLPSVAFYPKDFHKNPKNGKGQLPGTLTSVYRQNPLQRIKLEPCAVGIYIVCLSPCSLSRPRLANFSHSTCFPCGTV